MTPKRLIGKPLLERLEALPVLDEELVQELPPGRIGQGLEHLVHAREYR